MSRRKRREEEIRQVTEKLTELLDRLEAAFEEYRRQIEAAGPGEELEEGDETLI